MNRCATHQITRSVNGTCPECIGEESVRSASVERHPLADFKVETSHYLNGEIEQKVMQAGRLISTAVINTKEAQVREALIKLGWTPPR